MATGGKFFIAINSFIFVLESKPDREEKSQTIHPGVELLGYNPGGGDLSCEEVVNARRKLLKN